MDEVFSQDQTGRPAPSAELRNPGGFRYETGAERLFFPRVLNKHGERDLV